jgi:hypothetical protein
VKSPSQKENRWSYGEDFVFTLKLNGISSNP